MRYKELTICENILNEINMSPSNIRKTAQSLDATIGIEYEFIYLSEERIDLSTEIKNIDQIKDFFEETTNLDTFIITHAKWFKNKFNEEYPDFIENFDYYAFRFINEAYKDKLGSDNDIIENYKKYTEIIVKNNGPVGVFNNEEISEKDRKKSLKFFNLTKEFLRNEINDLYFQDFLKEENIKTMKDLVKKFDLIIRNKTYNEIKKSLQDNFYKNVNPSNQNYKFIMDESIKTNDGETPDPAQNMIGIEIVSPPQDLQSTIVDFQSIREFIRENGYVNETTGLHINISLPNFDVNKIDYLKLILLLGDNYILNEFNRRYNRYAKSSFDNLVKSIKTGWETEVYKKLDLLKSDLNQLASRYILRRSIDKNMSFNLQPDRVEFRSIGNNWIENNSVEQIINTVYRFIVVLEASMNTEKYQKEYAKKLTKITQSSNTNENVIKMFSNYASGVITKEHLKNFLRKRKNRRDEWKSIFDELEDL